MCTLAWKNHDLPGDGSETIAHHDVTPASRLATHCGPAL